MEKNIFEGLIIKALGGFYYVKTEDSIIECRARGVFRKKESPPYVGDRVKIQLDEHGKGTVWEIFPRKNEIVRPPIANLDKIFIVTSICEPSPNHQIIDKFIAISENKGIEPVILITKNDLMDTKPLEDIYKNAGFTVLSVNNQGDTDIYIEQMKELLRDSICAFTGNSGVGKSSFLNVLYPEFEIKTNQISQKLGRGKHTTRHVELYELSDINGYVADTPGFSTVDIGRYDVILKEDLQFCFREFEPYINTCKFTGCSHTVEKGCEILKALEEGKIEKTRHQSYVDMYEYAKNIKEWEL